MPATPRSRRATTRSPRRSPPPSTTSQSFTAAGGLPAATTTFADYSGQILGLNATAAGNAKNTLDYQQGLYADVKNKADSVSGVNIDEELADLIKLQQNYGAVSRVITVTSTLMDTLIGIVR